MSLVWSAEPTEIADGNNFRQALYARFLLGNTSHSEELNSFPMPSAFRKPTTVFGFKLSLPGALMPAILRRIEELKSGNLSRYIVELVAFDLRRLRAHTLTGRLARHPLDVQHAIDLTIDCHYEAGKKSNREQMDRVVKFGPEKARALGEIAVVKKVKHRVWLRSLHREAMLERSKALGFHGLTEYITSLIRFDLLLGGPHDEFPGDKEFDRPAIAELDEKTLQIYREKKPKKCMVDYVVEEAAGRPMTPEERDAELAKVSENLCALAVELHKKARKQK